MKLPSHGLDSCVALRIVTLCAAVFVAGAQPVLAGINVWTSHGPGAAVVALAIDPTSPTTLYAGTVYGGVFKSTDGALSWQAISTGLTDTDVSALAIDPAMPSTLYAGTAGDNGRGSGVFKSTDAGSTWDAVNGGLSDSFDDLAIAIDPDTPSTLYVATLGDHVFKSTDGAASWKNASAGLPAQPINTLAIDPTTHDTLYAGTGGGPSVYKSTDAGLTWQTADTGMPKDIHVRGFAIDKTTPRTLYAATQSGGVFKSTDGAASWRTVNAGLPDYGNGPTVYAIAMDPNTPDTLYAAAGGGVFKSTDGAASWRLFNTGLSDTAFALAIDPNAPNTLYAGAVGGFFSGAGGGVFSIEQVAAGVVGTGNAASCTDAALNAALASGVVVAFDCGGPATIDISTGTGTKTIAADTTIDGGGVITISGGDAVAVFSVNPGVSFTVDDLTIAGGRGGAGISNATGALTVRNSTFAGNDGGGIDNAAGVLTVANSTFHDNSSGITTGSAGTVGDSTFIDNSGRGIVVYGNDQGSLTVTNSTFTGNGGGGIANVDGSLTVLNSTFTGNSATTNLGGGDIPDIGGGISNGSGTLTVTNSTFSANSGVDGGGISNITGMLTVTNSTFTGNSARYSGITGCEAGCGDGGAIYSDGGATVANTTFAGNSATDGGGAVFFLRGTLTVINSTVTGNSAIHGGAGIDNYSGAAATVTNTIVAQSDCLGSITDGGHNLDDGTSCGFGAANGSLSNVDPQFDPAGLRDNGGPTQTVGLCTRWGVPDGCTGESPAANRGDPAVCAAAPVNDLDQRGLVRPGTYHTTCSMGAYEVNGIPVVCAGDCNNDNEVSVDELITLVSISLGTATIDQCGAAFLCGGDGSVAINCLVRAVNSALIGCVDPCFEGCAGNH